MDVSVLSGRGRSAGLVAALALFAAVMSLVATAQGPGVSVDSVYYASAGHAFATTGRLSQFDGSPITMWPPGLPVLLGTVERLGLDPQQWTRGFHAILVATSVVLVHLLSRLVTRSVRTALVLTAVVASSAGTTRVFAMMWTEPPFTVLTLLVLIMMTTAVLKGRLTPVNAVVVAGLVSLATTLRFSGVVLIATATCVALLVARRSGRSWGRSVLQAVFVGTGSSLGLVLVAGRNLKLGVGPLGDRSGGGASVLRVVAQGVRTLGRYVVPLEMKTPLVIVVTVTLGVLMVGCIALGLVSIAASRQFAAVPVALFTILWWLLLGYSGTTTILDSLDDRLTAPVFAATAIVVSLGLRRLQESRARERVVRALTVALVIVAVSGGAIASVRFCIISARQGIGFNDVHSIHSALAQSLADLPVDARLASNDPFRAAWLSRHSGIVHASREAIPAVATHLVWFTGPDGSPAPGDLDQLVPRARLIVADDQGTLVGVG